MDAIDKHIIAELRMNGRLSNQELADRVGLSPSPCLRRVRRLEMDGIISGYSATVDHRAYGLPVIAFVRLKMDTHRVDLVKEMEASFLAIDNVQECYLMAGDCDYLLKVMVDSIEGYEKFLREHLHGIASITSIDTSFVISYTKTDAPLPLV